MKLHQSAAVPQWASTSPGTRNGWQRVAARTNGILTPGNALSTLGLLLVALGLWLVADGRLWLGLGFVGIGRLCDIADGASAEATGTKSPLGEALDASFDKLEAFAALITLAVVGVLPWGVAALVLVHNVFVATVAFIARYRQVRLHPLAAGKITGAIEWLAIVAFIMRSAVHGHTAAVFAGTAGYILVISALALGSYAAAGYARATLRRS